MKSIQTNSLPVLESSLKKIINLRLSVFLLLSYNYAQTEWRDKINRRCSNRKKKLGAIVKVFILLVKDNEQTESAMFCMLETICFYFLLLILYFFHFLTELYAVSLCWGKVRDLAFWDFNRSVFYSSNETQKE